MDAFGAMDLTRYLTRVLQGYMTNPDDRWPMAIVIPPGSAAWIDATVPISLGDEDEEDYRLYSDSDGERQILANSPISQFISAAGAQAVGLVLNRAMHPSFIEHPQRGWRPVFSLGTVKKYQEMREMLLILGIDRQQVSMSIAEVKRFDDRAPELGKWTEYEALEEPEDFDHRLAQTMDIPWIDAVRVALDAAPEEEPQSMVELFQRLVAWPWPNWEYGIRYEGEPWTAPKPGIEI